MTPVTAAWRVHLLTAGSTLVRLRASPAGPGAPWPAMRALRGLTACGCVAVDRPDVLGAGRGQPLLTRHRLEWRGLALHLECRPAGAADEVTLELPAWDELVDSGALDEDDVWTLIDALAEALDAVDGDVGDGEGASRRAALLASEASSDTYTMLERSGLSVRLR